MKKPNILILDIETSPIIAQVWGLFDNNVAINQIVDDWKIISYAAKWLDKKRAFQNDTEDNSEFQIVSELWDLLDTADIIITQNGKSFDIKKINAKFVEYKLPPPSSFQQIDTKLLAKKYFAFTSNKLEYMTQKFNKKYKKLNHSKYPGQDLWTCCMNGDPKAWKEMRKYNIHDVLATEELYKQLVKWDNVVNFNVYYNKPTCSCGNTKFYKNGYCYTSTGKYQRFECSKCGSELKSHQNLLNTKVLRGTKR